MLRATLGVRVCTCGRSSACCHELLLEKTKHACGCFSSASQWKPDLDLSYGHTHWVSHPPLLADVLAAFFCPLHKLLQISALYSVAIT